MAKTLFKDIKTKIEKFALDILFPISCLACSHGSEWLCTHCFNKIKLLSSQACPYCEKNQAEAGKICPKCKERFLKRNTAIPLDNLIIASSYKENKISSLIHFYKYNFVKDLSAPLGKLIIKSLIKNNLPIPDLIIPIPLHPRRLRWRGFNQSELLANFISQNITPGLELPVFLNFISRIRYTKPQMKIKNYHERKINIKNAFCVNKDVDLNVLKDKKVMLVDDIATTGATLFECGRLLKFHGAKKVMGVVIARQELS